MRLVEVVIKVNMAMILTKKMLVMRNTFRVAVDSLVAFFLRAARSYPPPYLPKIPSFHIMMLAEKKSVEKSIRCYSQLDIYKKAVAERTGVTMWGY